MSYRTVSAARAILLAGSAAIAAIPAQAYAQDQEQVAAEANEQAGEASRAETPATSSSPPAAATKSLQDVPIAVTAYSGEQLERQGALDITDIGDTTPNVTLEASRGTNSTLTAFIRGVGQQDPVAGFEQGVGIYLDDVYLNRPQGAVLDIYDVERIEVLRGPQGTLYGRNTIGGAVKYVTRRLPERSRATLPRQSRHRWPGGPDRQRRSAPIGTACSASARSAARLQPRRVRQEPHDRRGKLQQGRLGRPRLGRNRAATTASSSASPRDYTKDNSKAARRPPADPEPASPARPVLDDEFDTRGGLDDPEAEGRRRWHCRHIGRDRGRRRLHAASRSSAWRKDNSSHPDRFRRAAGDRCRRPGHLQERAVQPGSAAGDRPRAARRHHRRLLSGRQRQQHLRRPPVHAEPGWCCRAFTA